jgi:hypothetical protein
MEATAITRGLEPVGEILGRDYEKSSAESHGGERLFVV